MTTAMARETAEAPDVVARTLEANSASIRRLAERLRARPPSVVVTSARGSSDNAASYLKYLVEILLGIPCASMGASVVSVYETRLKVKDALVVTISQSGRSPDILALQAEAKRAGALSVAIVNDVESPLASGSDVCLPLHAGAETSVAATKSFIASLALAAFLAARWSQDDRLEQSVLSLPRLLTQARSVRWSQAEEMLSIGQSLFVVGRGPALPIAQEAALKLKETCRLHAEAYSTAEVMHGPMELLGETFPLVVFSPEDRSRASTVEAIARLRRTGARVLAVEPGTDAPDRLAFPPTGHPFTDPVAMIQIFYGLAEAVARRRGHDPDHPRWLTKVTKTI